MNIELNEQDLVELGQIIEQGMVELRHEINNSMGNLISLALTVTLYKKMYSGSNTAKQELLDSIDSVAKNYESLAGSFVEGVFGEVFKHYYDAIPDDLIKFKSSTLAKADEVYKEEIQKFKATILSLWETA